MARTKKLSREELLARKRAAEQARRDKIKLNPETHAQYKEKEKQRYQKRKVSKKILPINDLTPRRQRNQRKKWKINSRNFRDRQRHKKLCLREVELTSLETDSEEIQAVNNSEKKSEILNLSPKLHKRPQDTSFGVDFSTNPGKSQQSNDTLESNVLSTIKRRARYFASKKLLWYQKQLSDLRKQNEMLRKRLFRNKNIKKKHHSCSPKSRAENLLSDSHSKENVKKALVFAEIVKSNLSINYENLKSHKQKQLFKENIKPTCESLKKYKVLKNLSPKIVRKVTVQKKVNHAKNKIQEDIKLFFESDNISRIAAGKKECITRKKEKKQKRYLLDSLSNLHKKFLGICQYNVSYSFFCKNKPFWVVTPVEKDKQTCMCKLHENVNLITQALFKSKIIQQKSANEILSNTVCSIYSLICLERKCQVCVNKVPKILEFNNGIDIEYSVWEYDIKKINTRSNMTKQIKTTIKKQHKESPKVLIQLLMNYLKKFYIHCANISNQYMSTTALKNQLECNEVVVHMDFSENYSAKYNAEIQSLHFGGSRNQISLHTSIIYAPGLDPISICTYSDCLRHDALAVWGHIVPILKFAEKIAPNIDTLHFITDSTCSQYRNKTINYIITKLHWYLENLKYITWNYSEAGHGKGAPDGVGATLKRTADQIVRHGIDIPDINSFAFQIKRTVKNVHLEYVSEYDIYEKQYFMPLNQTLKPFKGMMQVHQIVWNKSNGNRIALRRQSCVLEVCKKQAVFCVHGKHLGFHYLPELIEPTKKSCLTSDVVPLHRSQNFIATTNSDLPLELQCIKSNIEIRKIPESSSRQSIIYTSDESDIETSRLLTDFN